jgi:hypothetical protein
MWYLFSSMIAMEMASNIMDMATTMAMARQQYYGHGHHNGYG